MSKRKHGLRWFSPAVFVGILLLLSPLASAAALPSPLQQAVRDAGLPESAVGLWIQRIGDPGPIAALNVDQMFNPASTIKLATTLVALQTLGPQYTWRTEIHATAPVRDGVLRGDLILRGTGDPGMVTEWHWRMLAALRRTGLQRIEGNVLLDASHFNLPAEDPGAFDGQPLRAYNQPAHALHINANALRIYIIPEQNPSRVRVEVDPPLPGLQIINQLRPGSGSCSAWQRGVSYAVDTVAGQPQVILSGDYPMQCGDFELLRTAVTPEFYNEALFRLHWAQWGGEFTGVVRTGTLPQRGTVRLLVHESRPLAQLIPVANKWSSNVVTRHLALTVGAETLGAPATPDQARSALYQQLEQLGVEVAGMVIDNGSGLSRHTRITPRQLAQVLQAGWRSPWRPEFQSSLALAGLDGTLRRRFLNSPETGRMHLKTGHLNQVSAVAGYLRDLSDRDVLVVLLINHESAHQGAGTRLQQAVLEWAHRQ